MRCPCLVSNYASALERWSPLQSTTVLLTKSLHIGLASTHTQTMCRRWKFEYVHYWGIKKLFARPFALVLLLRGPENSNTGTLHETGTYFNCIMFMVASSVVSTILILNYHHRSPDTHEMSDWVRGFIVKMWSCRIMQYFPVVLLPRRSGSCF